MRLPCERPAHVTLEALRTKPQRLLTLRQCVDARLHVVADQHQVAQAGHHRSSGGLVGVDPLGEDLLGRLATTELATQPVESHEAEPDARDADEHGIDVHDGVPRIPRHDAIPATAVAVVLAHDVADEEPRDERPADQRDRVEHPVVPFPVEAVLVVDPDGTVAVVVTRRGVHVERLQPPPVDVAHPREEVRGHHDHADDDAEREEQWHEDQRTDHQPTPEVALVVRFALEEHADDPLCPARGLGREHLAVDLDVLDGVRVDVRHGVQAERRLAFGVVEGLATLELDPLVDPLSGGVAVDVDDGGDHLVVTG